MFNERFTGEKRTFIAVAAMVLLVFLCSLTVYVIVGISNKIKQGRYIGQEFESRNSITVSATGEIYAKPDLALASFTVLTEKKTVSEAMEENTEKMNDIVDFMKEQGIDDKDLKTVNFYIYPRYEWLKSADCVPPCPEGKRTLVGYEVSQSLQVKIRDLDKIGDLIQGAAGKGANQAGDLQFTIDRRDELEKQAREEAIEEAKEKAKELASQLGVNLVRITSFNEGGGLRYYDSFSFSEEAMAPKAAGLGGGIPQIQTGENKIEVQVTITYEIN